MEASTSVIQTLCIECDMFVCFRHVCTLLEKSIFAVISNFIVLYLFYALCVYASCILRVSASYELPTLVLYLFDVTMPMHTECPSQPCPLKTCQATMLTIWMWPFAGGGCMNWYLSAQ